MEWIYGRFFVFAAFLILLAASLGACKKRKELIDEPLYEGPVISMDSVFTKMSDSAKVIVILRAPRQNDYSSGDKEWPEGMYLEYLDREGNVVSTFRADYVFYTAKENLYKGEGNVVVKSVQNKDELNTEQLFWDPSERKFYTERFVTIKSEGEVHTGEGLTANQDFTSYEILEPSGTLTLSDE